MLEEKRVGTTDVPKYLSRRPTSRVVLETCTEAFRVADAALELGHEVRVVPGTLVRSLGVGARRIKTDRRDAQVLSEVSTRIDLPSVHIPSATALNRHGRGLGRLRFGRAGSPLHKNRVLAPPARLHRVLWM